jgi:hypothetical protein
MLAVKLILDLDQENSDTQDFSKDNYRISGGSTIDSDPFVLG